MNRYTEMYERIKNNEYENSIPFTEDTKVEYRLESSKLREKFKHDIEELYNIPESKRALIWRIAWDLGHGCGFSEVLYHYDELSELCYN